MTVHLGLDRSTVVNRTTAPDAPAARAALFEAHGQFIHPLRRLAGGLTKLFVYVYAPTYVGYDPIFDNLNSLYSSHYRVLYLERVFEKTVMGEAYDGVMAGKLRARPSYWYEEEVLRHGMIEYVDIGTQSHSSSS
jgi:hypothetical protein